MTAREQALFEAFKQRATNAERGLRVIKGFISTPSAQSHIRSDERTIIGCICDEVSTEMTVIVEDFCRQFPD